MTNQQHPITPPPELVQQWIDCDEGGPEVIRRIAARAAQWGAEAELDASCVWLTTTQGQWELAANLRTARRPKTLSLKEQALEALDEEQAELSIQNYKLIRAVLEQLDD
jgi:hypothetical protein